MVKADREERQAVDKREVTESREVIPDPIDRVLRRDGVEGPMLTEHKRPTWGKMLGKAEVAPGPIV